MTEIIEVIDPTLGQLKSMTKKQLMAFICTQAEANSQMREKYSVKCFELAKAEAKQALAESYVEQGRNMIEAVMERWHEYDV